MPTPDPDMPLPDTTAAELALGLLDGDERAAALRRLVAEPGFATEVERWHDRLAGLFADWPAVAAPAGVAGRIEASLDARDGGAPAAANDDGARWGRRWRIAAIAASIAACLLLAVTTMLMLRPVPPAMRVPVAAPAPLIAAIAPTGNGAALAAAYEPISGTVRIVGSVAVPAGRSAEVWAIRGTDAPRSLGVMLLGGSARMVVPAALRPVLAADTVLAISIEPAGGSPTGLPTGPVVAAGKLNG